MSPQELLSERASLPLTERVRLVALELLARHGLKDWSFRFNRRKRTMGVCHEHRRTIELSVHFVMRNGPEEILDTLLHEIAHALVGTSHGHDEVWKQKCREIGAKPQRCGQANMPAGKWRARCGQCGKQFYRHRRPSRLKGWHCLRCGPERGGLSWARLD